LITSIDFMTTLWRLCSITKRKGIPKNFPGIRRVCVRGVRVFGRNALLKPESLEAWMRDWFGRMDLEVSYDFLQYW
jgi:hypothetical protein